MKILSKKQWDAILEIVRDKDRENISLKNEVESLKKENAILRQAIVAQHIEFPNGAVRSTEIDCEC